MDESNTPASEPGSRPVQLTPTVLMTPKQVLSPDTPMQPNRNKEAAGNTPGTAPRESLTPQSRTPSFGGMTPIQKIEVAFDSAMAHAESLGKKLETLPPDTPMHQSFQESLDKAIDRAQRLLEMRERTSSLKLFDTSSNELIPLSSSEKSGVDSALIGKSLSERSSDAVDESGASSSDLSAAARADEAKAIAAGVDNVVSEEPSADEIDTSVSNLIEDAIESSKSASTSESSTSMSEEQSAGSMALEPDSEKSDASQHESVELGGVGKTYKRDNRYYKKLDNKAEFEDMHKFFSDHEGLDLTPVYFQHKRKTESAPYGVFVTEALEEGYERMTDFIKHFKPKDNAQKRQLRLALHHAFSKVKGQWNDLANTNNIAVKSNLDGTFDIRFYEGGRYDGNKPGTPHERAIQYLIELFGREKRRLPDKSFLKLYKDFL